MLVVPVHPYIMIINVTSMEYHFILYKSERASNRG